MNLRLMAIRSFTKYAGILDSGKIYMQVEVGNISIRKTPGTVVEFLTVPALETLFEQPNRFKTNGYRDFCFMRLMYDTAARCQELVDAKIHDLIIRKTHATICLAGKGNKLRIVPISPSVVELLKTYLDKAHPTEQRQSDDYLFFTTHHGCKNRMSTDAVNLFMKNMVKRQGGLALKYRNEYIHTNLGIPVPCICIVPVCLLSFSLSFWAMPTSTLPESMHGPILR